MKTFHYQVTPRDEPSYIKEDGETLTVGELIEALNKYPKEMPILATWEGIYTFVVLDDEDGSPIEDWVDGSSRWVEKDPCLILNVNEY